MYVRINVKMVIDLEKSFFSVIFDFNFEGWRDILFRLINVNCSNK